MSKAESGAQADLDKMNAGDKELDSAHLSSVLHDAILRNVRSPVAGADPVPGQEQGPQRAAEKVRHHTTLGMV